MMPSKITVDSVEADTIGCVEQMASLKFSVEKQSVWVPTDTLWSSVCVAQVVLFDEASTFVACWGSLAFLSSVRGGEGCVIMLGQVFHCE